MSTEILKKRKMNDSVFSLKNKVIRLVWSLVYLFFYRFSPIPLFRWRILVLKFFGADVHPNARVYPSSKIWLPSNLSISDGATLGPEVEVYNQGKVTIGSDAIVSQGAYLCASSHDYTDPLHPLVLSPIIIEDDVWVCAKAIVAPGVTVKRGSIIGLGSIITKNTDELGVYAGNPAKLIKYRDFKK
ncbi:putative colanic acid biosynthesis acetyltransferase [Leucothrix sargassi]|nr:putative colanic acid biosynthesis acetyltransferase [Leucothrix sargassi]